MKPAVRSVNVFYGHVATGVGFMFFGTWVTTQYVAAKLGYQPQLGKPLFSIKGLPIYEPWAWFFWDYRYDAYAPEIFKHASWIQNGAFFLMFFVMVLLAIRRGNKKKKGSDTYGSAKWATGDELKNAGLLAQDGVVLAQTSDALFQATVNDSHDVQWLMKTPGENLIRHNGPEHIFCFAPTRSGKGVGLVIPSLLTWTGSLLAYDIKKELWTATAGWRRQFSHCLRFEPTAADSVRFNPLLEIRMGENEVRDVQNVADILVDPDGSKDRKDHWEKTGHSLLVGVILHVLYAEKDKSLSGVASFLSDPGRSIEDTLQYMLQYPHLKTGETHPIVAGCAREMLNKSANELSGVVSTAMSFLGLYRDPVVARNTATSDFRIHDLMNSKHPLSLYLVVPPSDIERTKPLMRLILNQFGRRLTEKLEYQKGKHYRHRLLLMLDEFPSLGRLGFFETELAFMAGYGIKCFMIAQSLNQIEKAYGQNNSILDNSHVRVTYGALDDRTAERISKLLGQSTEIREQKNLAGGRLSPWLGHVMVSEQETARPLLTAGEVLQLPGDEAIVMVGNMPPYRGKKVMYYQDRRFKERAWMAAPDSPAEQQAELAGVSGAPSEWFSLPVMANIAQKRVPSAGGPVSQEGGGPAPTTDLNEKEMQLESDVLRQNELSLILKDEEIIDARRTDIENVALDEAAKSHDIKNSLDAGRTRIIMFGNEEGDIPL
jgi:type IV secretion system protein VirD4